VEAVRKKIAFYGSTPAYHPILELHGWDRRHGELNRLSKLGMWDKMIPLITDEIVEAMCSAGSVKQIAADLHLRYSGLAHRIRFNRPGNIPAPSQYAELLSTLRSLNIDAQPGAPS